MTVLIIIEAGKETEQLIKETVNTLLIYGIETCFPNYHFIVQ